jgi:hypothetical protein
MFQLSDFGTHDGYAFYLTLGPLARTLPEDSKKATQRLYHTVAAPSAVRVNVLPAVDKEAAR